MPARALSFGGVAEAYERFRPGYPAEIVDVVMTYANQPIRTALEIGAGTGKATRLFERAGVRVTASDPDADMLAELRKQVPTARTVHAGFEALPLGESFELVYCAAALHWTRAEGRWSRVAVLLKPGGVFANVAGPMELVDPSVAKAMQAARAPFLTSDEIPPPDGTSWEDHLRWPGTELRRSEWFHDVQQVVIERCLSMARPDYVGYLSTVSAYLELPTSVQEQAYREISAVLPETVEVSARLTVHLARRHERR
jgi:SAM-dependent methyltransferase